MNEPCWQSRISSSAAIIDNKEYKFVPRGSYFAPKDGDYASYIGTDATFRSLRILRYLEWMPNADISKNQQETQQFNRILLTQSRTSAKGGKCDDEILFWVAEDILHNNFNTEAALRKYPTTYTQSMNTVLVQEIVSFNRITRSRAIYAYQHKESC